MLKTRAVVIVIANNHALHGQIVSSSSMSNLSDSRTQSQIRCDNKRNQRQPHINWTLWHCSLTEISHSIKATVIQSHKSVHKSMVFDSMRCFFGRAMVITVHFNYADQDWSMRVRFFFCFFIWKSKKFYLQTSSISYWIQHNEMLFFQPSPPLLRSCHIVLVFQMCDHHHSQQ